MPLKRPGLIPAPSVVLGLLCLMYFITYVNRQNMATAGGDIIRDLHLTRGQLGKVIGAFGVTYAIFQIVGGWLGDRWGARRTLFVCGLVWASATALTGLVGGLTSLYLVRLLLGVGKARRSRRDPSHAELGAGRAARVRSRFHRTRSPASVTCHAADGRRTHQRRRVARRVCRARHRQSRVGGRVGLVLPRCPGRARRHHTG
jgi:hypothetical protein